MINATVVESVNSSARVESENLFAPQRLQEILGWVPTTQGLCRGYFFEPTYITEHPNPPPIKTTETTITATGLSTYAQKGPVTLQGNVIVTQPGREVTADKIIMYRNPETEEFSSIDLMGNVHFREAGKIVAGKFSHIDLEKNKATLSEGAYQISMDSKEGPLYGWGIVKQANRESPTLLLLDKATFTTCAPTNVTWQLAANHLTLNKVTGRGVANDAWLYAGNFPIFYTPYANFPIDKRRYSGFLYPSFGYDEDSGFTVDIPYYFNLAPNYDETFHVTPMTYRGVQFTSFFRYLTHTSEGFWKMSFLPNDRAFAHFKQTAPEEFPPSPFNTPFLEELENDSNNRGYLSVHDSSTFNKHWSGALDINYVTDAYYFRDLGGNSPYVLNDNQLLNQAALSYKDVHWQFAGIVQAFQALHMIDEKFAKDQYQRLPQFDVNASYPDQLYGLDYGLNAQWVNFQHVNNFFTDKPVVTGNRIHANPSIQLPLVSSAGFLTPSLELDVTGYGVVNNTINHQDFTSLNLIRTLPIFDIDSGIYLERDFSIGANQFRQTLEPRVFYLFVPEVNQDNIPIFDTTLPSFDYNQLFRTNRFAGYDRVGDANQISLGVTTRFLDGYTDENKLEASIGEIYYFHKYTVCLRENCRDDPNQGYAVSPITGILNFLPNSQWKISASAAWDPNTFSFDNSNFSVLYNPGPQRILRLSYNYVRNGDIAEDFDPDSNENNLQRLDLAASWPIGEHWNVVADWNYNISHGIPESYFYGVEYNTCCLAVRLVGSRSLIAENLNGTNEYRTNIYVQFLLKGLGTVGGSDVDDLINGALPRYRDIFKG